MSDDFTHDTSTTGSVAVGGTATGEIESRNDIDWFAVELVAGRHYVIDLEGADSGGGTLDSTVLRGLYDADGNHIVGSHSNFGGDGEDARLTFTATESGKYFIAARGSAGATTGTYTVRVTESAFSDGERAGAKDLGDITDLRGARFPNTTLDGDGDTTDYFKFTLSEAKEVELGLRQQDADADLFLEDAQGTVLASSTEAGTANERIVQTLLAGTYYIRAEAQEAGANQFKLRYGVSDADAAAVAALNAQQQTEQQGEQQGEQQTPVNQAPTFNAPSYAFDLAELADGSVTAVALGTVSASDPESATLTYSIEEGNDAGLFEIDESTGALTYTGTGEDYESGTKSYPLTVRASDGTHTADVAVTVSVTDVEEAPEFGQPSYAFDLAELADGSVTAVALGTVSATDPQNDTVTYSIEDGNDDALFEIDQSTGALTYTGTGEDYESDTKSYPLTVRASDGTHTTDVTVTVSVTDVEEAPAFRQPSYEFGLAEIADGSVTPVALGTVSATDPQGDTVTYSIAAGNDAGLFEIDESTGDLSYQGTGEDYESETKGYELTVRASDGTNTTDVAVTVRVTDVEEAPTFGAPSYEFDLAELADGSTTAVALGTVSATDPQGDTVTYSIHAGNDDALFAIDESTGALTYTGSGEDYETVPTSYELTVRASDGMHTADVAVTVSVTDVEEAPAFGAPSYAFDLAEGADGSVTAVALGAVSATDPQNDAVTYSIAAGNDDALFAIDESTGALTYKGSGEDYESGTTSYPLTVRASDGTNTADVTVTVSVTEVVEGPSEEGSATDPHGQRATAFNLGNITNWTPMNLPDGSLNGVGDRIDYYKFTLGEAKTVALDLRRQDADADLFIENEYGVALHRSENDGRANESISATLLAGTYYIRLEAQESGANSYRLRVGVSAPDADEVARLEAAGPQVPPSETPTYVAGPVESVSPVNPGFAPQKGKGDDDQVGVRSDDDFTADTSTTGSVAVGGTATGEIEAAEDVDWFEVTLRDGLPYLIDVLGAETSNGTLTDPLLVGVYNADGNLISGTRDDNDGVETDSRLIYRPPADNTYYIAVSGSDDGMGTFATGTYTVSVRQDDFAEDSATHGSLGTNSSVTGTINDVDDIDRFEIRLEADRRYVFDLKGADTGDGTLGDPTLSAIYDPHGNLVFGSGDEDSGTGKNAQVVFTPTADGTYGIAVAGDGITTGTYTLTSRADVAANDTTDGRVGTHGWRAGEIEVAADVDWFAVDLLPNRSYIIRVQGSETGHGTLADPELIGIYDSESNLIDGTSDDNSGRGNNSRFRFEPETAGTYYIAAKSADSSATGTYRVDVRSDDYEDNTRHPGEVEADGGERGRIDRAYDRDWFEVELEAGTEYQIDLKGDWPASAGYGSLGVPNIWGIYDSGGDYISGTYHRGLSAVTGAQVKFTPDTAGTYYISAAAHNNYTGTYSLQVRKTGDDFVAGVTTDGKVAVTWTNWNSRYTTPPAEGSIDYDGDRDWFAVKLEADSRYEIFLRGGTLAEASRRIDGIYDRDGELIDGTSGDRVDFRPTESGTYYISADAEGASTGTYKLVVDPDEFSADTSTPGTVAVGGSVNGIVDYARDEDWVAVDLVGGRTYQIDMKGRLLYIAPWDPDRGIYLGPDGGHLIDTYLHGIYDSDGNLIDGTTDDDSGSGKDAQVEFTPEDSGTYYIAAGSDFLWTGGYRIEVEEM